MTLEDLRGGDITLWVEGLEFAAEVKLQLAADMDEADPNSASCTDQIQLKVAPLILLGHAQAAARSYVSRIAASIVLPDGRTLSAREVENESRSYTLTRFPNVTPSGVVDEVIEEPDNGGADQWAQDQFQIGYQEAPYAAAMNVVLDSKRDRELKHFPPTLVGPNFGYVRPAIPEPNNSPNDLDSFGNLEVSPPFGDFAHGRVYYGHNVASPANRQMDDRLRKFLDRQAPQTPVVFDTDWLFVGHVDEFMTIVPNPTATHGWSVVLADPVLALDILKGDALVAGGVDEKLHIPRYSDHEVVQLGALLGRMTSDSSSTIEVYNAAGGPVDLMMESLGTQLADRETFGFTQSEDIYRVPVLFDSRFGKAVAITPNLVNSTVYGTTLIAPDPFLHASTEEDGNGNWRLDAGEDANGNFMLDTLRDPFQFWFNANLPLAVSAVYIDDWFLYHLLSGEVHCSSNEKRTLPVSPKWWENAP